MDEVAENSDELMEHYLEGKEISHEEMVTALKDGRDERPAVPDHLRRGDARTWRSTGCSTRSSRTCPSPVKAGAVEAGDVTLEPDPERRARRVRVQDAGRPVRRAHQPVPRLPGHAHAGHARVINCRTHSKERIGQLLVPQGKEMGHADEFGPGDIGAVAKLKETHAGDLLCGERPRRRRDRRCRRCRRR